jgi:transposase
VVASNSALATAQSERDELRRERDSLQSAYQELVRQLQLLRRRIFVAKAERVSTAQLELEFAATSARLAQLGFVLEPDDSLDLHEPQTDSSPAEPGGKPPRKRPSGRRNLKELDLPEERIEIPDPLFEPLVLAGKAERIGTEDSYSLGRQRSGGLRVVTARFKYRLIDAAGQSAIETAPLPPRAFPRSLLAPSLAAHALTAKYCDGLPFFRVEQRLSREGLPVDRGTLSRQAEELGALLGATVVQAMKKDARSAFCIATDATGISLAPIKDDKQERKPCRKGHFFVLVADRDHVLYDFTAKHNSSAVIDMLGGYDGYVQADANSVYDSLFRDFVLRDPDDPESAVRPTEVGCWAHCRRGFWEAALTTRDARAREAMHRIARFYELEEKFRKKPPSEVTRLRAGLLAPEMQAFFAWAEGLWESEKSRRGPLRSALGYAMRQKQPLLRVLEDGRLPLDNNRSERNLRTIAVGRKAWLFCGSDDHAQSAANLFSLIASAKLHGLDPELYLTELLRLVAQWPRDRYLELSPKYWARTRARLDPTELQREFWHYTIPGEPLVLDAPPLPHV